MNIPLALLIELRAITILLNKSESSLTALVIENGESFSIVL